MYSTLKVKNTYWGYNHFLSESMWNKSPVFSNMSFQFICVRLDGFLWCERTHISSLTVISCVFKSGLRRGNVMCHITFLLYHYSRSSLYEDSCYGISLIRISIMKLVTCACSSSERELARPKTSTIYLRNFPPPQFKIPSKSPPKYLIQHSLRIWWLSSSIFIIFPSVPIKCASVHFSSWTNLNQEKRRWKKERSLFSFCYLQEMFLFFFAFL